MLCIQRIIYLHVYQNSSSFQSVWSKLLKAFVHVYVTCRLFLMSRVSLLFPPLSLLSLRI